MVLVASSAGRIRPGNKVRRGRRAVLLPKPQYSPPDCSRTLPGGESFPDASDPCNSQEFRERSGLGGKTPESAEITIASRNQHPLERAGAWRRHLRTSQLFATGAISESRLRVSQFAPCLPLMTIKRVQETASLIGAHPLFLG